MDANIKGKFKQILEGKVKYTSGNLAVNMLISRLQKKIAADPGSFDACIQEIDAFAAKYPSIVQTDYAKILAL
ncbi:MAG: hypothetical protein K5662_07150 [Lachnospiraceae bacterium]|nr:hypothetical protein [Lachnospiraceae bacterium]